jgi:anti-sigma factor RsiW
MTCRELNDFVLDYLSSELPVPLRQAFDRHLDACVNCRMYLATYEATIEVQRLAFRADPAPEAPLPEDLVQAILAACESGGAAKKRKR